MASAPRPRRRGPGRAIGIFIGVLVILAIGVYGPLTLLGPLPEVDATITTPKSTPGNAIGPVLPTDAESAISVDAEAPPVAKSGTGDPVPMAGIAKIVTALVVLKAKPMEAGSAGPSITITAADYRSYIRYATTDARAILVRTGETWTEQGMMQALILGSSNNHADALARWAYGSIDGFLKAANAWLTDAGLTHTHLADATGLSAKSAGTASDLARLAAIAMAEPTITGIITKPASGLASKRDVEDTTAYLAEDGITGISRSYTDAAGVCFLFSASVDVKGKAFTFYGAFIREPGYSSLTADLKALMSGARSDVHRLALITKGEPYVSFHAAWGASAHGIAASAVTVLGWQAATPKTKVDVEHVGTAAQGTSVGAITVTSPPGHRPVPLILDAPIAGPGPGWRLLHPVPAIQAFVDQQFGAPTG